MATEYQFGQFMLVASYNSTETQHFSEIGVERTLCGLNRRDWMVMRAVEPADVDSAYTCRNCITAMAKRA